ncbi:MAG: c-type cytochrome [Gemmatimonadetes bacterium]|nr:c-type cytochrome [Gemmatimonadota bacterium]
MRTALAVAALTLLPAAASAQAHVGAIGQDLLEASGDVIYNAACANCHGVDGRGAAPELLAFEEELPDFTDCDFAAREPDADWIAVAHEGGPVRGFSEMMPAFRGALTVDQLGRVMEHIRTMCTDDNWPRGELNLPRALLTEKAYPEDEWVVEAAAHTDDSEAFTGTYVYERRFGPRSQVEITIPYGWRDEVGSDADDAARDGGGSGLGDVSIGLKHAFYHDIDAGWIFSVMGEMSLPTGNEAAGLGAPGSVAEVFLLAGQILPGDAFLQAQAGVEAPLYRDGSSELFGRFLVGASRTEGPWGRTWSPMVELQVARHMASGAVASVDLVPQVQVALNTRQHVLANFGVLVPVGAGEDSGRSVVLLAYVLLDWFDGGFLEGW